MNLLNKLNQLIDKFSIRMWSPEEKKALLKIVHEIYNIDCDFSQEEKADFNKYIEKFELEVNEVIFVNLGDAISTLKKDEKKLETAYEWIAEAIYKDGVFNESEVKFVEKLEKEYGFSREKMNSYLKKAEVAKQ